MKIILISHYYPPEPGAPQARLSEMVRHWVGKGHSVNIITCFPNHPDGVIHKEYRKIYSKKKYCYEMKKGVHIHRCWVYATPNKGKVKKIIGHLSFMLSSVFQAGKNVKNADIIIVSSPTLFSAVSAWYLSQRYRVPYIFEIRDLWPAIFVELGVIKNRIIIGILEKIELFLYRKSSGIVPVTNSFADNLIERGIPANKIRVIKNGVDLDSYFPRERNPEIISNNSLENKFIVLYLGAHGISHALTKIVDVAHCLQENEMIHFLLVGDGAEKETVETYALKKEVKNITFLPAQSKEQVPDFYSIADIGLVPLRDVPLFDTFIPSKMFEIMAMGLPIVASVRGESADILKDSEAALICDPEDVNSIKDKILSLYSNSELRANLGKNGVEFVLQYYDRKNLAGDYLDFIGDIVGSDRL